MLPDLKNLSAVCIYEIAELAVNVPAVWSSIFTYTSPPMVVTAVELGCPINSLLELLEWANSPAPSE